MSRTRTWWFGALLGLAGVGLAGAFAPGVSAEEEQPVLLGTVLGSEGPIAGAEVAVGILSWDPTAGDHTHVTKTDGGGRWALHEAPLGPVDVWVRPEGGKWKFAQRLNVPSLSEFTIDGRPHRDMPGGFEDFDGFGGKPEEKADLPGIVTDKKGKPVPTAAVNLGGKQSGYISVDAEGKFVLPKATKGANVVIRANGYMDIHLEVKSLKKGLKIKLTPAKETSVKVVDPDGKPVAKAWVALGDLDIHINHGGGFHTFPPNRRMQGAWTDAEGIARIPWAGDEKSIPARAYAKSFGSVTKSVPTRKGPTTLKLVAQRPVLATARDEASGEPLANVLIGIPSHPDADKRSISAVPQAQQRGPLVIGRTDDKGQCRVPHLPADVKQVWVVGDMQARGAVKIEPVPDEK